MSVETKFQAGSSFPAFEWSKVGGGSVSPAAQTGWRLVVVYRGAHCPLCKQYLSQLDGMQGAFHDAGLTVWALSADPIERASSQVDGEGWTLPILAGLTDEHMRSLGLYISAPRSAEETDRNFAEPGIFVINPAGQVQIVDVSNAPFARPEPKALLNGIRFVMDKNYPIRGTIS